VFDISFLNISSNSSFVYFKYVWLGFSSIFSVFCSTVSVISLTTSSVLHSVFVSVLIFSWLIGHWLKLKSLSTIVLSIVWLNNVWVLSINSFTSSSVASIALLLKNTFNANYIVYSFAFSKPYVFID
jgi:hypothetical protein